MMSVTEARQAYYELSGKASDAVRQLGLAGVAVIWVFKTDVRGTPTVPEGLVLPALLIVVGLFLDLLQYVLGAAIWGAFARRHEKKGARPDALLGAPPSYNWPALVCYYGKVGMILWAYVLIGLYLRGVVATWYNLP